MIVSTLENSIFAATVEGLSRVLREEGYAVLLGCLRLLARYRGGADPCGTRPASRRPGADRRPAHAGRTTFAAGERHPGGRDLGAARGAPGSGGRVLEPGCRCRHGPHSSWLRLPSHRLYRHRGGGRPARPTAAGRLSRRAGGARRGSAARAHPTRDGRRDHRRSHGPGCPIRRPIPTRTPRSAWSTGSPRA